MANVSWDRLRPQHSETHALHFTGRQLMTDTKQSFIVKRWGLEFYWHCEQCEWYFVEYLYRPGVFRPYTEAWKSDLDIMCKGCTTGRKGLKPKYEISQYVDL